MSDTPPAPPPVAIQAVVVWEHDVLHQPSAIPAAMRALFDIQSPASRFRVVRRETVVGQAAPQVAYVIERRTTDALGVMAWADVGAITVPQRQDGTLVLTEVAARLPVVTELLALLLEQARAKGSA